MIRPELLSRIQEYANRHGLVVGRQLGFGVHGIVFEAENQSKTGLSALKAHEREADYIRELSVYLRLKEHGVTHVRGCNVPALISSDDKLWIIEMTVVSRPYVLDFAGAYLDQAPEFSEEVMADWRAEKQEQFGGDWREVQAIIAALRGFGVFLEDVSPSNISFRH